jgi:GT2 family glycosyltransferase
MPKPPLSVILINWNQRHFLKNSLAALATQADPNLNILIVDNNSSDGSPEWIAHNYPNVNLLPLPSNHGFAPAFNRAVNATSSPLVLSLNPDVTPRPDFVAELIRALDQDDRIGMVAPKLLRADDPRVLDSTGLFIDRRRRPYDRGQGKSDQGQYDQSGEVFGACGAAALYRREMLEDITFDQEYFDESFFAYYEDADLAWRAQKRGWRCVYAPRAIATHVRGGGDTLRKSRSKLSAGPRLALRNRYLMTIKNDTGRHFLADLPLMLAAELPRLAYATVKAPRMWLGLLDLFRAWPAAWRKRHAIHHQQLAKDAEIRHWFTTRKD